MMDTYARRVGAEEAREGYLLVAKARLAFFPPEGELFTVDDRETAVESYACTCRGPDRPHRHWFLRLDGLHPGDQVTIGREEGRYQTV